MSTDRYVSPLSERYASKEMQYIFSPDMKFRTWRRLLIALAETEKELGLNITQEQIDELKAHAEDINYDVAKERERQVRHDVMSHVYAYGVQFQKACLCSGCTFGSQKLHCSQNILQILQIKQEFLCPECSRLPTVVGCAG